MNLKSDANTIIVIKVVAPLLWLTCCFLLFGDELLTWRAVFYLPLFAVGVFLASLAVVEINDVALRYRYFARRRVLPLHQIVSAGTLWAPFVGYIRLDRSLLARGIIFFVLDRSRSGPFSRGEFRTVEYLKDLHAPRAPVESQADSVPSERATGVGRLAFGLVFGAAVFVLVQYLTPSNRTGQAFGESAANAFYRYIGRSPVSLTLTVIFSVLAVAHRHQRVSWTYAFVVGVSLSYLVMRWI